MINLKKKSISLEQKRIRWGYIFALPFAVGFDPAAAGADAALCHDAGGAGVCARLQASRSCRRRQTLLRKGRTITWKTIRIRAAC